MYACYAPKCMASDVVLSKRRECWEKRRATTHWCVLLLPLGAFISANQLDWPSQADSLASSRAQACTLHRRPARRVRPAAAQRRRRPAQPRPAARGAAGDGAAAQACRRATVLERRAAIVEVFERELERVGSGEGERDVRFLTAGSAALPCIVVARYQDCVWASVRPRERASRRREEAEEGARREVGRPPQPASRNRRAWRRAGSTSHQNHLWPPTMPDSPSTAPCASTIAPPPPRDDENETTTPAPAAGEGPAHGAAEQAQLGPGGDWVVVSEALAQLSPPAPPPRLTSRSSSSSRQSGTFTIPVELVKPGMEMLKVSAKSARRVKPRKVWLELASETPDDGEMGLEVGIGVVGGQDVRLCWEKNGPGIGASPRPLSLSSTSSSSPPANVGPVDAGFSRSPNYASVPLSRIRDLRFASAGSPYRTSLHLPPSVEPRWMTVIYAAPPSSGFLSSVAGSPSYKLVHFIALSSHDLDLVQKTLEGFKEGRLAKGISGGPGAHDVPPEEADRVVHEVEVHQLCARLGMGMSKGEISAAFQVRPRSLFPLRPAATDPPRRAARSVRPPRTTSSTSRRSRRSSSCSSAAPTSRRSTTPSSAPASPASTSPPGPPSSATRRASRRTRRSSRRSASTRRRATGRSSRSTALSRSSCRPTTRPSRTSRSRT